MDEDFKQKLKYTFLGVIGAGLISWGTIFTIKSSNLTEQNETKRTYIEILKEENRTTIDASNVSISELETKLSEEKKNSTFVINSLSTENETLTKQKKESDWRFSVLKRKHIVSTHNFQTQLDSLVNTYDSLMLTYEGSPTMNIQLQELENQYKDLSDSLSIELQLTEQEKNVLQHNLNAYMIFRRPIKQKHLDKTFVPTDQLFLPYNRDSVKMLRQMNREYNPIRVSDSTSAEINKEPIQTLSTYLINQFIKRKQEEKMDSDETMMYQDNNIGLVLMRNK